MLDEAVLFCIHYTRESAPPQITISGKQQVVHHVKTKELPRSRKRLVGAQPIELLADGRTSSRFNLEQPKPMPSQRVQDVVEWSDGGLVRSWRRVIDPHQSQHDWLRCVSKGRTAELGQLLTDDVVFLRGDVTPATMVRGRANVLEAIDVMGSRFDGHVLCVGRTRELHQFQWPLAAALLAKLQPKPDTRPRGGNQVQSEPRILQGAPSAPAYR